MEQACCTKQDIEAESLAEGTRLFETERTVKNEQCQLLRMLQNLIGIGLKVSKVGDCSRLKESF
jgi:hypothetical protein